jgi:hypothetical protein
MGQLHMCVDMICMCVCMRVYVCICMHGHSMNKLTQELGHCILHQPLMLVLPGMPTRVPEQSGVIGAAKGPNTPPAPPVHLVVADAEHLSAD